MDDPTVASVPRRAFLRFRRFQHEGNIVPAGTAAMIVASVPRRAFLRFDLGRSPGCVLRGVLSPRRAFLRSTEPTPKVASHAASPQSSPCCGRFSTPQGIPQISTSSHPRMRSKSNAASVPRRAFLRFRLTGWGIFSGSFTALQYPAGHSSDFDLPDRRPEKGDGFASVPRRAFLRFRPTLITSFASAALARWAASVPRRASSDFDDVDIEDAHLPVASFSTPQGIRQISTIVSYVEWQSANGVASVPRRAFLRFRPAAAMMRRW